jgi:hypothetical protein
VFGQRWDWITRIRGRGWDPVIGIALVGMFISTISTAILDVFRNARMKSAIGGCGSSSSTKCCATARGCVGVWIVEHFLVIIDRGSV